MRRLRRTSIWVAWTLVSAASACSVVLPSGSETNWFGRCSSSSECTGGSECLCGVCTTTCQSAVDCQGNMQCTTNAPAAYAAQCGAPAPAPTEQGICQPGCAVDGDCQEGQGCFNGMCAWLGNFNGPTISQDIPPPPISGGTMATISGGHAVAVADPDRDQVAIVDVDEAVLRALIPLSPGDEPGRIVEDARGFVHVVLRRAGAVVTIDPLAARITQRRDVCPNPRGIAVDDAKGSLIVACAGGELVTLPTGAGAITRRVTLADDLRDVVVDGDHLLVSRFRAAEILVVAADGQLKSRFVLPSFLESADSNAPTRNPAVAWRMVPTGAGGAYVSLQYQRFGAEKPLASKPVDAYSGDGRLDRCGQNVGLAVRSGIARISAAGTEAVFMTPGSLPVDIGVLHDKPQTFNTVAMASAGNRELPGLPHRAGISTFWDYPVAPDPSSGVPPSPCVVPTPVENVSGQVVAVAFDYQGRLVAQSRDPWRITIDGTNVELPGAQRKDTGHDLFHTGTRSGIACASCHPEGRDDGFVWTFDTGRRRTQSLAGGISGTAPFHWEGDMNSIEFLLRDVFTKRMSGFQLTQPQAQAMLHFIDSIPAWKASEVADLAAVERGRALFNDENVACSKCHSGARFTDNRSVDVGTGGIFQVPSLLGVSRRAPFLHDGRAPTLEARFMLDTTDQHGHINALSAEQRTDLVSYLKSL